MTIQQLMIFLAVCRELNYTKAAGKTYMSRQAVRQNIAELERELNGPLFENRQNHLFLTAKGQLLQEGAQKVVDAFHSLQQTMNADMVSGQPLRLGVSLSLVPDYLPSLKTYLADFDTYYPNLEIQELQMENDDTVSMLLADALDACLVMDMGSVRTGLERTELSRHRAAVLTRSTHPLYRRESVSSLDLDGLTLYLPGLGEEFEPLFRACREAGAETKFVPMPGYYQVLYHVIERESFALNRYDPREETHSRTRSVPFREDLPLCSSFLTAEGRTDAPVRLLRDWLVSRFRESL
jgi:protein-tyrosine phosphatase